MTHTHCPTVHVSIILMHTQEIHTESNLSAHNSENVLHYKLNRGLSQSLQLIQLGIKNDYYY